MLWRVHKAQVNSGVERWRVLAGVDTEVSFFQVFEHWRIDEGFRAFWNASLRQAQFDSYGWECPPVTLQDHSRAFECVLVSSPLLAGTQPDPEPFAEHFRPDCEAVMFESLGKDALLVAPCPGRQAGNFAHLASFIATAPESQASSLWQAVGEALERRIGSDPTWLSTAGLGVSWLHVRLDTRPKYYRHAPYRRFSAGDKGA